MTKPTSKQLDLIAPPPQITRDEALRKLDTLCGQDLRPMADHYGITVCTSSNRNKGWAGQVVERFLGQAPNSSHESDFEDFELKVIPIALNAKGEPYIRETMAITMFTAQELEEESFEESHLLIKMRRIILCARSIEGSDDQRSLFLCAVPFDLDDPTLYDEMRSDYEEIRFVARQSGLFALTGSIGRWIQPRPKGDGHCSGGCAFYAKKNLLSHILGLDLEEPK